MGKIATLSMAALLLAGCARTDGGGARSAAAEPAPAAVPAPPAPVAAPAPQTDTPGAKVAASAPATAVAARDADPALWLIKDGDTNVYLFGTVHLLRPGQTWFDEGVRAAYDRSSEVVLEVVQPEGAAAQATQLRAARAADGKPLRSKLSPATRAKYEAAMKASGLPAEAVAQFDQFDPWFAALTLSLLPVLKAGYNPAAGAETVITAAAKGAGKPVGQLETVEQQLGFFDELDQASQIKYLEATLDSLDETTQQLDQLAEAWAEGDTERLGALMNEALRATPEVAKALLTDRNARWAQWIDDRMDRPGTVFVAVGAGHLAGADSVQAMLAKRKLRAERVRY